MKLHRSNGVTHVTLSRRNLLELLWKLSQPDSLRAFVKLTDEGLLHVKAEEDEPHYGKVPDWPMPISLRNFIKKVHGVL